MNDMHPTTLWLRSNGSGSIILKNVTANSIDAESSVSGQITATGGSAQTITARTDASGKIEFYTIAAKQIGIGKYWLLNGNKLIIHSNKFNNQATVLTAVAF